VFGKIMATVRETGGSCRTPRSSAARLACRLWSGPGPARSDQDRRPIRVDANTGVVTILS
jgi:hypothetical protein